MKIINLTLAALLTIAGTSAIGAKQAQISENVSSDKTFNVRVNPLGLAIGSLSAEGDFRLSDKWTLGPSISHYSADFLFTSLSGWGFGARSNYYLTGNVFEDSWIVGTSVGLSTVSVTLGADKASGVGLFLQSVLGYQWVWTSGLNLQLALGGSWYSQGSELRADNGTVIDVPFYHGIKPAAELTVGYVF